MAEADRFDADPPPDGSLTVGTELGRYAVLGPIGRGATLEVYAAKIIGAQGFEKAVALKVPSRAVHASAELLDAFVLRAKRAFSLSHANILGVIDLGRAELSSGEAVTFLVTERARGSSLDELVARARAAGVALPLGALFRLGAEVAKALDHAHRRNQPIAHGALNERKLFISAEGQLKLGDFGLSEGAEQAAPAADLVALAALMARLIGGASVPDVASALLAELDSGALGDAGAAHDRLLELSFSLASERAERSLARLFALVAGAERATDASLLSEAELDAALSESAGRSAATHGRFVGRAEELGAIARALADARQRGAHRGWLVGPSGVGKTRLVRELARRMPSDAGRVVFVACSGALARAPFGAAVVAARALASLGPSGRLEREEVTRSLRAFGCDDAETAALSAMMGTPVDPAAARAPLHEAMLTLVAGASVPVLLAVDDATLLDASSAALFDAMVQAERARDVPLFIALLAREASDAWLTLPELDDDAVAQLLASRLGARVIPPELFELVIARAGGNPLFIEALAKQLGESALVTVERGVAELSAAAGLVAPASLAELAEAELAGLPEREREALALMTVTDAGAEPALLAAALAVPEAEARAVAAVLESRGVARRGSRGELFAASLYREAALRVTSPEALVAAHLRAASFLRASHDAPDHSQRLVEAAAHFTAAGALSQAALAYCEAARGYEIAGALDVAASLFARALPAIDSADEAARSLEALARLAERANLSGVDLEEGIGHALALSDGSSQAGARVALRCRLAVALGRYRALELADVLLEQAEAMSAPVLAAVVVTSRLALAALAADPQRARDALGLFVSEVVGASAPPVDVWLDAIEVALLAGDARRARGLLEVVPEADANLAQRARVLSSYARLSVLAGDREAAPALYDQAVALAKLAKGEPGARDVAGRQGVRALLERAQLDLDAGASQSRAFARLSEVVEWSRTLGDRSTLELALSELEALERGPLARAAIELRVERARAEGRQYDSLRLAMVVAERLYGRDEPALKALASRAEAAGLGELSKRAQAASEPATIAALPRV